MKYLNIVCGSGPVGLGEDLASKVSQFGVSVVVDGQDHSKPMKPSTISSSISDAGKWALERLQMEDVEILWFVCTKTSANAAIAKEISELPALVVSKSNVIVCQNGFEPEMDFDCIPLNHRPIRVVVNRASAIKGPDSGSDGNPIKVCIFNGKMAYRADNYIGCSGGCGDDDELVFYAAKMLTDAGYVHIVDKSIEKRVWKKALVNCCCNAPCALIHGKIGEMLDGKGRDIFSGIAMEVLSVAKKHGVEFDDHDFLEKFWSYLETVRPHYPSMVTDVENKRQTEIDTLNGFIVKLGQQLDVSVPVNRTISMLVQNLDEINMKMK